MRGRAQKKMYENVKRWRSQAPKLRERLLQARAAATKICTVRPPAIGKWPKVDDKVVEDFKAWRAAGDLVRWALPCHARAHQVRLTGVGCVADLARVGAISRAQDREGTAGGRRGRLPGECILVSPVRVPCILASHALSFHREKSLCDFIGDALV